MTYSVTDVTVCCLYQVWPWSSSPALSTPHHNVWRNFSVLWDSGGTAYHPRHRTSDGVSQGVGGESGRRGESQTGGESLSGGESGSGGESRSGGVSQAVGSQGVRVSQASGG